MILYMVESIERRMEMTKEELNVGLMNLGFEYNGRESVVDDETGNYVHAYEQCHGVVTEDDLTELFEAAIALGYCPTLSGYWVFLEELSN